MTAVFNNLYAWLTQSVLFSLIASFIWGLLSILLSPCHLSSIPLITAVIISDKNLSQKKSLLYSIFFSIGIFISIIILGLVTSLLGRLLGDIGKIGNILVSIVFIIFGFVFLDVLNIDFLNLSFTKKIDSKTHLSSFIIGFLFGIGVGPCTFGFMAPVLALSFKVASTNFIYALSLILVFALGHSTVIILALSLMTFLSKTLKWSAESKSALVIKRISGILLILAGAYSIFKLF
ncbi:MAG: cytochrome c biogenesis CcdA family protein [bacterium]